ncbi:putative pyruvate, phosphate dikinase regulatory protein [Alicyclobacillus contaminans]|uniref:pyruvate, water dikinase regulatory protein n=1 Tax=Alicyclobacillus contaminans TaxID=392016 RepID=UPI000685681C|nr:pyruvate, water dikinase regulatory protein [Alicyclobacillus contaminans]GMA52165.1 putative pyruvate, phosphate dikinase regulatory protein [Alicyclobacillus contaminans]
MPSKTPIVYIVSDSVGETAEFVVRAAASQFDGGNVDLRRVSHVNDVSVLDEVVASAREESAIIAYTVVVPELREHLATAAAAADVPLVDIMGPMLAAFEQVLGERPHHKAGLVHQLDDEYFRRVEAIEFAVKYDDGRDPRGLERADIVLVGVSRTSKTPLSMYLAHRRLRVANVPLVPEVAPPDELFQLERRKIVGLTIRPDKLNLIRQERLKSLGLTPDASYASPERIAQELEYANGILAQLGCRVIDVSDKAVEETAAIILEYAARRK